MPGRTDGHTATYQDVLQVIVGFGGSQSCTWRDKQT